MPGFSRARNALMALLVGSALVFAGCAETMMTGKEMTKEPGAMKAGDGMKKEGEMMKDDKGMMKK